MVVKQIILKPKFHIVLNERCGARRTALLHTQFTSTQFVHLAYSLCTSHTAASFTLSNLICV